MNAAPEAAGLPPVSLYVHLPWCERKCPYCDFNSYEARDDAREDVYVEALLRDLEHDLEAIDLHRRGGLHSVYFGGGTPSLFSAAAIATVLDRVRLRAQPAPDCEITLEANPGSADAARFRDYRAAGVTRLSIGIQSFRDEPLGRLGRIHSGDDARRAVEFAQKAGFSTVNLDLMYGLPGDDPDGAMHDLETALSFGPSHLSWYQLTLEPGTAFFRRPPPLQDEDSIIDMEPAARRLIENHGLVRYEVSGYARPGAHCRHNLNYWQFGDYIGIGAGAHGKISDGHTLRIGRTEKIRQPRRYMAALLQDEPGTTVRTIDREDLPTEFMMNALRLVEGVDLALFERRTGLPRTAIEAGLAAGRQRRWLSDDAERIQATDAGFELLNRILSLF